MNSETAKVDLPQLGTSIDDPCERPRPRSFSLALALAYIFDAEPRETETGHVSLLLAERDPEY